MQVIRDTAFKFPGYEWRSYDGNFGRMRATQPLSGDQIDLKLFLFSMSPCQSNTYYC
jgi:hypothetical protein